MDINAFYERVLKTLDVGVRDDYLYASTTSDSEPLKYNGLPLTLPTKGNVGTVLSENEDGNIVQIKHLYNPLDETIIKGDSPSLIMTKRLVETRTANRLAIVGKLLLIVSENTKLQAKTPMLVNQFLMRLNEAENPGIKKVVDPTTIEKWVKIYDKSFETDNLKMIKVFVKKGGKIGTTKYNRTATFRFPIYEELLKVGKGGSINGVKLRNKDITVFKIIFQYLVEGLGDAPSVVTGSNDKESPGFIALFKQYLMVMLKIQEVIKGTKEADQEWSDTGYIEMCCNLSELNELAVYKRELAGIPREGDFVKSKIASVAPPMAQPVNTTRAVNTNYVAPQPQVTGSTTANVLNKVLYNGRSGVNVPTMQPQQPIMTMQPQQPMMPMQPQQPMMPMVPVSGVNQVGCGQPQSIAFAGSVGAFGGGTNLPPQPFAHNNSPWNR